MFKKLVANRFMVLPDFHTTQILIIHLHNETKERNSNPIIGDLGDKISLSILCARVIFESCIRKIFCSGYKIITKQIISCLLCPLHS